MTRRLIIFDCDGTLVDSQHVITAAMEHAFEGAGLPAPGRLEVLGIVGLSLPEAFWRLAQAMDPMPDEATHLRLIEGYKNAFGTLRADPAHNEPMYPGARETVLELAARDDVALGIATGKSRRGVDRLLKIQELEGCFETIQTADDAPSKPHPAMIEQAMQEADADAARTMMIGDTTYDIHMALGAGVAAFGVGWGYHSTDALHKAGAHLVADDFARLRSAIEDHAAA